jgi:hypothetical protein
MDFRPFIEFSDQGSSVVEPPGKKIFLRDPFFWHGMVDHSGRHIAQSLTCRKEPAAKFRIFVRAWNIGVRAWT